MVQAGLDGVVAAETALSLVDGERGELVIAGFSVAELALNATFEETAYLLWHGELPDASALVAFRSDLARRRSIPPTAIDVLAAAAARRADSMDALRMAAGILVTTNDADDARTLLAAVPTIVAAYWRLLAGRTLIPPRSDLSHAANYLYMLTGEVPSAERVRGLEAYLNTVVDHGLNASTFTARVIASTGSDLVSAIVGAIGALKGPLHGGATDGTMKMLDEIASPERTEAWVERAIASKYKFSGFGHRVYKTLDPRAPHLRRFAEDLATTWKGPKYFEIQEKLAGEIAKQ
ncbi:MAG TPA: citrate/2-methylcitrate synthase, partial [Thermoanaerobaculia bacterium]